MRNSRKDFWLTIILFIAAVLFFFLMAILKPAAGIENRTVWVKEYDINFFKMVFGDFFTEPFETLLIVFKDGEKPLTFTTKEAERINIDMNELKYLLEKRRREVKDIAFTVHNHLTPKRPTPGNHRAHNALKGMGFEGPSFVYYPATGEIKIIKEP